MHQEKDSDTYKDINLASLQIPIYANWEWTAEPSDTYYSTDNRGFITLS